jgi:hypothetical protein
MIKKIVATTLCTISLSLSCADAKPRRHSLSGNISSNSEVGLRGRRKLYPSPTRTAAVVPSSDTRVVDAASPLVLLANPCCLMIATGLLTRIFPSLLSHDQ